VLRTASEIREEGWNALVDRLGVSGAVLFILEHERGEGDYVRERKELARKKKLDAIVGEIRSKQG
jgi:hypothetical protein